MSEPTLVAIGAAPFFLECAAKLSFVFVGMGLTRVAVAGRGAG